MRVFLDASALTKRYIKEKGSDVLQEVLVKAKALAVSVICVPETISGLCRLQREKKLTAGQYAVLKEALIRDVVDAEICQVTHRVVGHAILIFEKSVVRAMDALHIGCAMEWKPDLFLSSDNRQLSAAEQVGLKVMKLE